MSTEQKEDKVETPVDAHSAPKNGYTPPNPMSKRQQKRQKKLMEYEKTRKEKRIQKKQKRKEAISKGLIVNQGPSRKALKTQQLKLKEKIENNLKIAIDLDFDEIMSDRDISKCVKQCLRIYTINRRSQNPVDLHFTGIKKDGRIHNSFKRNDGSENWIVKYHYNRTHLDAFEKSTIVYLTSESDTILQNFEQENVYVIGGLVDHNHQKGLCHERAEKLGIKTARLPLSEHVDMKTRSVLSTYHVFEIILRLNEGKSWTDAILSTLPSRKGATVKGHQSPAVESDKSKTNLAIDENVDEIKL